MSSKYYRGNLALDFDIDKTEFIPQFQAETKEHIQKLNDGLIMLEKDPQNIEIFEDLMREAHSIKGSAAMMDFEHISKIAHKMEDALSPDRQPSNIQENMDILFECIDAIELLLEEEATDSEKETLSKLAEKLCEQIDLNILVDIENTEKASNNVEALPASSNRQSEVATCKTEQNNNETIILKQTESLRVNLNKLNELMNLSGEMLISKIRLSQLIKALERKIQTGCEPNELEKITTELKHANEKFSFVSLSIQDEIMKLRMVPVSNLFSKFPRAMRDLAHKNQKKIDFEMSGQETYMDKSIIDQMKDPLLHILRNAVDHGIESPEERLKKQKSEAGKISLNAYHLGSQAVIEIIDDGKGIDIEKVKSKAVSQNLESPGKINQMTNEQIFQFLFTPGFSTTDVVTETSGRGVGMDVVKESILKLKGSIDIKSHKGEGTKLTIKLPLTLMITECLLVDCGNEVFGLPVDNICETVRIDLNEIRTIASKEVINIRDEIVPLARLNNLFSIPQKGIYEKRYYPVIIVQSIKTKLAVLVDQIIGHHEAVIKNLGYPLKNTANISGGTIMGDGKVVLILDIPSLVEVPDRNRNKDYDTSQERSTVRKNTKTILLAEDTLNTAMLEKNILESAGFKVVIARDGKEALEKTKQNNFDLVITDVLMPGMNGYELTETLKKDKNFKDIPVVIVTTRESDSDKRKGLRAGADAYIIKKDFTSDKLLETIDKLIATRN